MFNAERILREIQGMAPPVITVSDLIGVLSPLVSLTKRELLAYRGRAGCDADLFHGIYSSRGVYAVQFEHGVWIGSTETGDASIGRRWRRYVTSRFNNPIYLMAHDSSPDGCIFHALALADSENETRFIEHGLRAWVEAIAPQFLLNRGARTKRKIPKTCLVKNRIALSMSDNPRIFPLRVPQKRRKARA